MENSLQEVKAKASDLWYNIKAMFEASPGAAVVLVVVSGAIGAAICQILKKR